MYPGCLSLLNFSFQLAVRHGVKFFETSALSGQNVEEAFLTMAGDIKKKTEKKLVGIRFI